jgi:hypothetical protein
LATGEPPRAAVETAWQVLGVVQLSVARLEDSATRLAAAQVAGFIALWTQLSSFEQGAPRVLAWIAWGILLAAVIWLAPVVMPRRLGRFWSSIVSGAGDAVAPEAELAVVKDLIENLANQYGHLFRHLRISIRLSVAGVLIAAIAYIVEKAF